MEQNKQIVITVAIAVAAFAGGILFMNLRDDEAVPVVVAPESGKSPESPAIAPENPDAAALSPAVSPTGTAKPVGITPQIPAPTAGKVAPEIKFPSGYTNADPFLLKDFIGKKVVLLNFWDYTSINAMRTVPYLNKWNEKYKNKGLVIVSIHTPRFTFEKEKDNVDKAAFAANMLNPIVLDNQYATWNAWGNTVWPTQYLIDINGRIAYTHKGEGDYLPMEVQIQNLLAARSAKLKIPVDSYSAFEVPANAANVELGKIKTPEIYFGSARNESLGNGTPRKDGIQDMKPVGTIIPNTLYLSGSWDISREFAKSAIEGNKATVKYTAKNVYAVFGALKMNRVKVTLDGQPLTQDQLGKDVRIENGQSYLYVTDERLYDIVKGSSYGEHTIELTAETNGLQIYVLMFG